MRHRLRRLLAWCGFTQEALPTYQLIVPRLSDVVPTEAEARATAALQLATSQMVSTEPYGRSVMEEEVNRNRELAERQQGLIP